MCGRYTLIGDACRDRMNALIEICNRDISSQERIVPKPSNEVSPGDLVPGLITSASGVCAAAMRWGFTGGNGGLVINARSEDAAGRAMFRHLLEKNRCALPASGYFEWRRGDGQKYLIAPEDGESLYLLGLWKTNEIGKRVFVILTRPAYGKHAQIHARMPVIVRTRQDARRWLNGSLSLPDLIAETDENLCVEALGAEQMSMDFVDQWPEE